MDKKFKNVYKSVQDGHIICNFEDNDDIAEYDNERACPTELQIYMLMHRPEIVDGDAKSVVAMCCS